MKNSMIEKLKHSGLAAGLVFALLAGPAAAEQYPIEVMRSGIPHDAFFAVDFDGEKGVAVGASPLSGALLYRSTDGGKTWSPDSVKSPLAALGVTLENGRAVAVGQQGLVMIADEAGEWQTLETFTPERLMNVDANRNGLAVAVGAFGSVFVSRDGGKQWSNAAPDWMAVADSEEGITQTGPNLYGVSVEDDGRITIAGEWGLVLRSTDAGATWRVLHAGDTVNQKEDASLFNIHVGDNGRMVAVGQVGQVLYSEDDGATWKSKDAGTVANLLSVTRTSGGTYVATAMRDMRISRDGGRSWAPIKGSDFAIGWYSGSGTVPGQERVFAAGHSGRIVAIDVGEELAGDTRKAQP